MPVKYFEYKENALYCEDVLLSDLAEEYGTPLYVYSKRQIIENLQSIDAAFIGAEHLLCYALKANANHSILKLLSEAGAGADIVSGGELHLALKAGFLPNKIVFAGVGKRADEIEYALQQNIFSFNVESVPELQAISRIALRIGKRANISLRINPDIDAQSHPYITTGLQTTKFGIEAAKALEVYRYAATLPSLNIIGIHTHIGSQITKIEPFVDTAKFVVTLIGQLREAGIQLTHIDFGGGVGVPYFNAIRHEALPIEDPSHDNIPEPADVMSAVLPLLQATGCSIWMEPGRAVIADAGVLLTRVVYIKDNGVKKFVIVDGGLNDLIRPSLYHAHHQIVPLVLKTYEHQKVDVVGPICESTDFFAQDRELSNVAIGDGLAILTAGAYGFVLSSNYNGRLRPAEILVNGERVRVIRPRETMGQLE
jgi:diaminopimelate decarboxylase